MAFDLYFAGASHDTVNRFMYKINANHLFNYLTERKHVDIFINLKKEYDNRPKIFVDSGAFTAWSRAAVINVDEYITWLNERTEHLTLAGQLDVIPGTREHPAASMDAMREAAEKTWENYLYMRERLINPDLIMYTYHVGEPIEFLKQALEWRDKDGQPIKYMALGAMVGKNRATRDTFIKQCRMVIQNSSNPEVHLHAFGMTDMSLLEQYRMASADSTTWLLQAANGYIYIPKRGYVTVSEQQQYKMDYITALPTDFQNEIMDLIQKNGFSLETMKKEYLERQKFNILMMHTLYSQIENKHKTVRQKSLF